MAQARCTLAVDGLDCPVEATALRRALEGSRGVVELGFDLAGGTMTVRYDPAAADPPALVRRVSEQAGMKARVVDRSEPEPRPSWWGRHGRFAATAASGGLLALGMILSYGLGLGIAGRAAFGLAIAAGGLDLLPRAWRGVRRGRLDIHALMGLAIAGAVALGQWDEAATVAFLFGLSEALEAASLVRARDSVRALLEVTPETAERVGPGGATEIVPAAGLAVGDRVRVRAGEKVPVDGTVVAGRSSVDQKAITGESVPVSRGPGEPVFAGSVNGEGALEVEATCDPGQTIAARIASAVRAAQAGRAPIERGIERFAAVYTPLVVAASALVMAAPPLARLALGQPPMAAEWFARGLVVLVIACPCALVIATPVAVVSALAAAARRGILIKGGQFLEEFGRLRVLAFDKTGTLTRGEPAVVEVVASDGRDGAEILRIAAALGDRGGHVLGRAIARHARERSLAVPEAEAEGYTAVPGLGASGRVEAVEYHIGSHRFLDQAGLCRPAFHAELADAEGRVGTAVAVSTAEGPLGWIRLADRPRPEAAGVLEALRGLGIEAVMLTGDNGPTAAAMAGELGIAESRAGLLPADKAEAVAELDARRGPTGMVGDGVNDAPALARARVSVALGGVGSASALETADVVLMADDLSGLPWLVRHARATLRLVRQNIALALGTKAVVLALAVFGLANLWMAIAADLGTSLLVTANALRLLRRA